MLKRFIVFAFHPNFALGGARDLFCIRHVPLSRETLQEAVVAISVAVRLRAQTNLDPEKDPADYVFQIFDLLRGEIVAQDLGREIFQAYKEGAFAS